MAKTHSKNIYWLWLSAAVLIADQISKAMIRKRFDLYEYEIITPFFDLIRLHNTGAAFSFLADQAGWQQHFFVVIALIVSVIIVIWMRSLKGRQVLIASGLSLLLGGALGNAIDRVSFGYVTDFLYFNWQGYYWPAFNVADMAICAGAAGLIIDSLFGGKKDSESAGGAKKK
ncbi:MAG: signal peptidase II [Myxococcota bacterium]|jgi:signal peptidase II